MKIIFERSKNFFYDVKYINYIENKNKTYRSIVAFQPYNTKINKKDV